MLVLSPLPVWQRRTRLSAGTAGAGHARGGGRGGSRTEPLAAGGYWRDAREPPGRGGRHRGPGGPRGGAGPASASRAGDDRAVLRRLARRLDAVEHGQHPRRPAGLGLGAVQHAACRWGSMRCTTGCRPRWSRDRQRSAGERPCLRRSARRRTARPVRSVGAAGRLDAPLCTWPIWPPATSPTARPRPGAALGAPGRWLLPALAEGSASCDRSGLARRRPASAEPRRDRPAMSYVSVSPPAKRAAQAVSVTAGRAHQPGPDAAGRS